MSCDTTKQSVYGWKYIHIYWRCLWCNVCAHRKWTWLPKFKSWTRLFVFRIMLVPLGKLWIQLFSFHLWVNNRADWVLQPWFSYQSIRTKTLNSNHLKIPLKNWPCVTSCWCGKGWVHIKIWKTRYSEDVLNYHQDNVNIIQKIWYHLALTMVLYKTKKVNIGIIFNYR